MGKLDFQRDPKYMGTLASSQQTPPYRAVNTSPSKSLKYSLPRQKAPVQLSYNQTVFADTLHAWSQSEKHQFMREMNFRKKKFFYVYVCVPCPCKWPQKPEEVGIGFSGAGVTDSCEPPRGCWELNCSPLQEQKVVLFTSHPPAPWTDRLLKQRYQNTNDWSINQSTGVGAIY